MVHISFLVGSPGDFRHTSGFGFVACGQHTSCKQANHLLEHAVGHGTDGDCRRDDIVLYHADVKVGWSAYHCATRTGLDVLGGCHGVIVGSAAAAIESEVIRIRRFVLCILDDAIGGTKATRGGGGRHSIVIVHSSAGAEVKSDACRPFHVHGVGILQCGAL